ncbi:hypothetical protein QJS04_geneDACA023572 [Acorus gramineus]|uniref:Uncharacterized protein n=2 Tax=Acorus gramineus TaxID=55184 RepID=A0AAV9A091_ACOGR|nr:hypothetical protein QJS04_geneDACA023572 [Acorus gramineus]
MSDSLVRVSRRVGWGARGPMPEARGCQKLARPTGACCYPDRADDVSAGGINHPGFGRRRDPQWSAPRAEWRTGSAPFRIRPRHTASPHPLPSRQFQALFDSLFKVLFILPSRYLFAIGLSPVFSLRRNLPPYLGCIPKQPDSPSAPHGATGSGHDGALTLSGAPFQGTWARSATDDASTDYNSNSGAARFSSWALPVSLAVTRGILRVAPPDLRSRSTLPLRQWWGSFSRARCHARPGKASDARGRDSASQPTAMPCRDPQRTLGFSRPPTGNGGPASASGTIPSIGRGMMPRSDGRRDAQAGVPSTRWVSGATCVQRLDGSRDSAIHTKYRISLRSSSMREPRYPLPRVITVSIVMIRCAPRGFGPALPAPGVAVAGQPAGWVRGRCHAPRPLSFLSGEFLGADRAGVVVRFPRPARGAGLHRANRGAGAPRARVAPPRACPPATLMTGSLGVVRPRASTMILPQVHLRKPCYDFSFL